MACAGWSWRRWPESGSTSGDSNRRVRTPCSPALTAAVSTGPARGMRSRTWRRSHVYSSIRDAHRAAARGPPLGAGLQPRGEGNGAVRSHAGDHREGARPAATVHVSDVARRRYRTITVENARKFARYFGCSIEDLFPPSG